MTRITKWLLFGVLCGVLPLLFEMLKHITRGTSFGLVDIVGNGELLLITTAISATGVGELLSERPSATAGVMLTGFASIALTAISAFWFADISSATQISSENVKNGSLIIFFVAIVSTFTCFKQTEVPAWRI